ncbi:T9SS type A sorting domain-containing protein [Hymenobacter ruricola]|uniref:T9SS type A sorting domain-containing protein n=1 Tax=Hymenobacter ruricola TaxID=2791023 RepID=A0ABS0I0S6_9BACT|nr:T9SS type A sorting domain-containing protein [Hymenobacter ruricola]MBF9220554.1 T9SS type A sorting domain-containing protein [Hymenobacter ruricola]
MPASLRAPAEPNTAPAPVPSVVVDPPQDPNLVRVVYDGVNAVCAGDHLTVTALGGNGTYSWSTTGNLNPRLSANTGATVVVGPLVTTTYTVTSTNPSTGAPTTATFIVNVLQNCCPKNRNRSYIKEVSGTLFNSSATNPFIDQTTGNPFPAGTRFRFTDLSANPIIFSGLAFQPPMGSVLMVPGGKDLYLQDGASLNLSGVSITADCDDMWGKLWVRNSAAGISSTFTDGATADPTTTVQASAPGLTSLRNQVSHSLGGIEFEQPSPTVTTPSGAVNVPYCRLTNTDFLHNERSIALYRSQYGENIRQGVNYTYVTYSAFDSNPSRFKAPKLFPSGNVNYPHYSQYNVLFTGFGGTWGHNSHTRTLFGFHSPDDGQIAALLVQDSQFADCYLAGINVNTSNQGGGGATGDRVIYSEDNSFSFPTILSLPTTPQFANAIAADVADQVAETRGIYSKNATTGIYRSTFTQAVDSYSDFTFFERSNKQIGVKGGHVGVFYESRCTLLYTGLELTEVTYPMVLDYNVFTACSRGVTAQGRGVGLKSTGPNSPYVTVSLKMNCNTFDRGDGNRPGTAYGVYLGPTSQITFDPLPSGNPGPAPVLTNKFLDYNTGISGFFALYNLGASSPPVTYTTYGNYILRPNPTQPGILLGHSDLSALCIPGNVTLLANGTYDPNIGAVCGFGNPGLERGVREQSDLKSSSPNPASDHTTLNYILAPSISMAELQIRRSIDGKLVYQSTLLPNSSSHEVQIRGWQAGLYIATMLTNKIPVKSVKLSVL